MLAQTAAAMSMLARAIAGSIDRYQPLGIGRFTTDPYQSKGGAWSPYSRHFTQEITMKLLTDLFTTDYGIMSISGIAFMLGMAVFFLWYFKHKMNEAEGHSSK
jgi:hypothetical protein